MSQIVDLNSPSNINAFFDYLLNDINLDSASSSETLIENTFGTLFLNDEITKDSVTINSGKVDLAYDESSLSVKFSLNAQVKTDTNLTFDTVLNGSISNKFDTWSYLASNNDLINSFGSNTGAAIQHYISNGFEEGRSTDNFDEWGYLASNPDLINFFGSDVTSATQHYVTNGYSEGRSTSAFNPSNYFYWIVGRQYIISIK